MWIGVSIDAEIAVLSDCYDAWDADRCNSDALLDLLVASCAANDCAGNAHSGSHGGYYCGYCYSGDVCSADYSAGDAVCALYDVYNTGDLRGSDTFGAFGDDHDVYHNDHHETQATNQQQHRLALRLRSHRCNCCVVHKMLYLPQ